MILLLACILFTAALLLILFVFIYKGGEPRIREVRKPEQDAAKNAIAKQDEELAGLSAKLKTAKDDYARLQAELLEAKKKEEAALEEVKRVNAWIEKGQGSEVNVRKEIEELKEKLIKKDQEHEQEFSLNLSLKKESQEYKQKLDMQEKANQELSERVRILEAQTKGYKEELDKREQVISEFKKKWEDTEWVSKKEYERLKAQLDKKEAP